MSKASLLLDNIVTTLRGINGPSLYVNTIANTTNGDAHQVEALSRHQSKIPQDQFPHFNVILKSETKEREPGFIRATLSVDIVCTFYNSTETEIGDWIGDVETSLAQDVRRGQPTFCFESWVMSVQRDSGAFDPFRIITMNVEVSYSYPFGSP